MPKNKEPIFAERLRYAMTIRGMKSIELCRKTGLKESDVSNYRYGYYKPIYKSILAIAEALNVAPEWLDGYDVPMEKDESNLSPIAPGRRVFNILSFVSCGCGTFNDGEVVDTISLPEEMFNPNKEYFGMYAKGDSMIDAGIKPGDLLIFERCSQPSENRIGAFCINNETALCKRYKSANGKVVLMSANDNYAPIVIDVQDECFRCVGLLSHVLHDYSDN